MFYIFFIHFACSFVFSYPLFDTCLTLINSKQYCNLNTHGCLCDSAVMVFYNPVWLYSCEREEIKCISQNHTGMMCDSAQDMVAFDRIMKINQWLDMVYKIQVSSADCFSLSECEKNMTSLFGAYTLHTEFGEFDVCEHIGLMAPQVARQSLFVSFEKSFRTHIELDDENHTIYIQLPNSFVRLVTIPYASFVEFTLKFKFLPCSNTLSEVWISEKNEHQHVLSGSHYLTGIMEDKESFHKKICEWSRITCLNQEKEEDCIHKVSMLPAVDDCDYSVYGGLSKTTLIRDILLAFLNPVKHCSTLWTPKPCIQTTGFNTKQVTTRVSQWLQHERQKSQTKSHPFFLINPRIC